MSTFVPRKVLHTRLMIGQTKQYHLTKSLCPVVVPPKLQFLNSRWEFTGGIKEVLPYSAY